MNELQKEFEATGYASWIDSDIYPDGTIYTKEYTEWLEKKLITINDIPPCSCTNEHVYKHVRKPFLHCPACKKSWRL